MDDVSRARCVLVSRLKTRLKASAAGLELSNSELHDWADEMVCEGIALACQQRDRWNPDKGGFVLWCSLKTEDVLRRELRKRTAFLRILRRVEEQVRLAPGPKDEFTRHLIRRELYDHFNGLTPDQRKALTMYYLLDIPVAEISQVMNKEPKAVYGLLHRAKKKLRQLLGGPNDKP